MQTKNSGLVDIHNLLQVVFGVTSTLQDFHDDPHLVVNGGTHFGEYEVWPSSDTVNRIGGSRTITTWELFETVFVPSHDRDVPPEYDSLPRGEFKSVNELAIALMTLQAKRAAEYDLQVYDEKIMAQEEEELTAVLSTFKGWGFGA